MCNIKSVSFPSTLENFTLDWNFLHNQRLWWLWQIWGVVWCNIRLWRFICFHTGHKRNEILKAFTWMSTKCLFKILYQMYLFLHRPQNNLKLEGFHLNGDKVPFQNTLPNLFVSVQATKEWKIERLSPEWWPRVFS